VHASDLAEEEEEEEEEEEVVVWSRQQRWKVTGLALWKRLVQLVRFASKGLQRNRIRSVAWHGISDVLAEGDINSGDAGY